MDDDQDLLRLFTKTLAKNGYRVLPAMSMERARTLLTNDHFDVFVCDMNMGEERGIDLLREMRPVLEAHSTEVLVLSADDRYFAELRELGYQLIIEKPILPSSLINIIRGIQPAECIPA